MILGIPDVVASFLPDLSRGAALSVVRIQTTRPVFLVFAASSAQPVCVMRFAGPNEVRMVHEALEVLQPALPGLVPESLVCSPWDGGQWIHIQSGMPGIPWFRLRSAIRGRHGWLNLRTRASQSLADLHAAVRDHAAWTRTICPARELREQHARLLAEGTSLSQAVSRSVTEAADGLETLGSLAWYAQHGDFCLNNLLVSRSGLGVIDFEEFGATAMPLHDELGLALSFHDFLRDTPHGLPLHEHINACVERTLSAHPFLSACLWGLFLHHLLWRANQCHQRETRRAMECTLIGLVEHYVRQPQEPFLSRQATTRETPS